MRPDHGPAKAVSDGFLGANPVISMDPYAINPSSPEQK
jgi:hypothetical protein